MRKPILILMIVILAALLITPAMAASTASGVFYRNDGTKTNETGITHTSSLAGRLQGIYFRSAQSIPQLGAVKLYMDDAWHPDYLKNTTTNSSYVSASLKAGNTVVSTGVLVWDRNDINNDLYLAYFPYTWDPSTVEDRSFLNLTWNKASFDVLFTQGITNPTTLPLIDNNLLFAGFYSSPGTGTLIPASSDTGLPGYNHQTDYADIWAFQYATGQNTGGLTSYLDLIRYINTFYYKSLVQVNETVNDGNYTVYKGWGTTDTHILSINNQRLIFIDVWDPQLRHYGTSFNLSSTYEEPETPGIGDIDVYAYDGSKGSLFDGVLVQQYSIDAPGSTTFNEYGYTGVGGTPGMVSFWGMTGWEFNFTASATGYETVYTNYTVSTFPAIIKMYLYPIAGSSVLEFMVRDNLTDVAMSGVPVQITNTSGKWVRLTTAGFARFSTVSGINYDWLVADPANTCDDCYIAVSGNRTASAGTTRIELRLDKYGTVAGGTGEAAADAHAAAEETMEVIYSMLPGLLMIVFLFLFLGVMGFTPGGRRR